MNRYDHIVAQNLKFYKPLLSSVLGSKVNFVLKQEFEPFSQKGYYMKSIYTLESTVQLQRTEELERSEKTEEFEKKTEEFEKKTEEFEEFEGRIELSEKRIVESGKFEQKIVGELAVLAFMRGDGTGDSSLFSLDQVGIPAKYKSDWMPTKVLPRSKNGVHTEYFLPIASVLEQKVFPHTTCLDEITVSDAGELVHSCCLGMKQTAYTKVLIFGRGMPEPRLDRTVGYSRDNVRFGDPHSVYFTPSIAQNFGGLIQLAGFFAVRL